MEEQRVNIAWYLRYQVSTFWRVRSFCSWERVEKKIWTTPLWYSYVTLWSHKNKKKFRIWRLVALSFLPNPLYLPEVNHKDFDRSNNKLDNLERVSRQQNISRSRENFMKWIAKREQKYKDWVMVRIKNQATYWQHRKKPVTKMDLEWNEIERYESIEDANRKNGFPKQCVWICNCCKWRLKTYKWFKRKYTW